MTRKLMILFSLQEPLSKKKAGEKAIEVSAKKESGARDL